MIRSTLGALTLAFAATAHATNPPESPPSVTSQSTSMSSANAGAQVDVSVISRGGSANASTGAVTQHGGSSSASTGAVTQHGGSSSASTGAVTQHGGSSSASTGAVSQQGGNVTIEGSNVRAGAVTFSATQPPPVAGGMIGISVSHCLPFKNENGTEGYRAVRVGDETWYIGRETADAAGNFGKSDGSNVGVSALLVGGQYGQARGESAPGWISKERECIAKKQQDAPPPPPPPPAATPPRGELTIHAPTVRGVQTKVPCKVETFTDSKGQKVDMCRGPVGSWTKTELVQDGMTVRVAPTVSNTRVTPAAPGTTVVRSGDQYLLGNAPKALWCEDCPPSR